MRNKLYWGIATLIILIICAAFFSIQLIGNQDTEPQKVFNTPSVEVLDNLRNTQDTEIPETADKPQSTGETLKNSGHFHNGEWHETAQPNTGITTSLTTGGMSTNEFQELIDNHPVLQPQAIADRKAIEEYKRADKEYDDKHDELNEQWKVIIQESNKLDDIPLKEIMSWSDSKKLEYVSDQKAIMAKLEAHEKLEDAHRKTKPIRPDAAYKRHYELWESLKTANNQ